MAMHSAIFMSQNPEHTLVIIVGDFHVAYQDGLVARLRARGIQRIVSVSQVSTTGLNEDERRRQIQPHDNYGPRADFIFETE